MIWYNTTKIYEIKRISINDFNEEEFKNKEILIENSIKYFDIKEKIYLI